MPQLPSNGSQSIAHFETLAADKTFVADARRVWREAFLRVGAARVDSTWQEPLLQRLWALPNRKFKSASETLLTATDNNKVLDKGGCLLSVAELATATKFSGPSEDKTKQAAKAALTDFLAGTKPQSPALIAQSLHFARELYDAIRRLKTADSLASEFALAPSECLAFMRQETALIFAPPAETIPFAPLSQTAAGACRDPKVDADNPTFNRDGFNANFKNRPPKPPVLPINQMRFDMAKCNFVYSGLDVLGSPVVEQRDELVGIYLAFLGTLQAGTALAPAYAALQPVARVEIDTFVFGLLVSHIAQSQTVPSTTVGVAMDRAVQRVRDLFLAHDVEALNDFVVLRSSGAEAHLIFTEMARWYSSRRRWSSLQSIAAQTTAPRRGQQSLSPMLGYLRFHTGDEIFVGIVLRVLREIEKIKSDVRNAKDVHRQAVAQALGRTKKGANLKQVSRWADAAVTQVWSQLGPGKQLNITGARSGRFAWRHLGLADAWRAANNAWIPPGISGASDPGIRAADTITKELLLYLEDLQLYEFVEAAIRHLRVDDLLNKYKVVIAKGRQALVNAHSFEGYRAYLEKHLP